MIHALYINFYNFALHYLKLSIEKLQKTWACFEEFNKMLKKFLIEKLSPCKHSFELSRLINYEVAMNFFLRFLFRKK